MHLIAGSSQEITAQHPSLVCASASIVSPMLLDQVSQKNGVGFDAHISFEKAELDMVVEKVEFDAQADEREGNHDGILAQVIQPVIDALSIQIVQEGK
jgi:hypothetical protein